MQVISLRPSSSLACFISFHLLHPYASLFLLPFLHIIHLLHFLPLSLTSVPSIVRSLHPAAILLLHPSSEL